MQIYEVSVVEEMNKEMNRVQEPKKRKHHKNRLTNDFRMSQKSLKEIALTSSAVEDKQNFKLQVH
jgi:hypothetical protein